MTYIFPLVPSSLLILLHPSLTTVWPNQGSNTLVTNEYLSLIGNKLALRLDPLNIKCTPESNKHLVRLVKGRNSNSYQNFFLPKKSHLVKMWVNTSKGTNVEQLPHFNFVIYRITTLSAFLLLLLILLCHRYENVHE